MNDGRWAEYVSELELAFEGSLGEMGEKVYRQHLGDMDYDLARAALSLLVADGQKWLPKPGEVMAAAQRVVGPRRVPWGEAWPAIVHAMRHADDVEVVREVARTCGEGAARFVHRHGVGRLRVEPTEHPEWGGAALRRLQVEYEDTCDAVREDGKVGLALAQADRAALAAGRPGVRALGRPGGAVAALLGAGPAPAEGAA